jgi:hypothetical protein
MSRAFLGGGPRNDLCSKAIMIMNCNLCLDPKVDSSCASHPDLRPLALLCVQALGTKAARILSGY